ncbi:MAG: hypothetical protein ACRD0L_03440 [Acidimicrobiales bacterium]
MVGELDEVCHRFRARFVAARASSKGRLRWFAAPILVIAGLLTPAGAAVLTATPAGATVPLNCSSFGGDSRTPAEASVKPGVVVIGNYQFLQFESPQYQAYTIDSGGHLQLIGANSEIDTSTHLVAAWQNSTDCSGDEISRNAWIAAADGTVYGENDLSGPPADNFGDMSGKHLNKPIVGMAPTADGKGYWLVASDGGIFSFGDAQFHGSTGAIRLNKPIVGMAATPDGRGYWLVASDGGVFTFGDAHFYGSMGGVHLAEPVTAILPTPDGRGYWMVASDGGIFTFGDATFKGSTGGRHLSAPIAGMIPNGNGYTLIGEDGQLYPFS